MFVKQTTFDAMKQRAESAEATLAAINNLFGEAATADGFDVVAAIKSLGTATEEVKPNAALAALAAKHNVQPESNEDAAVIKAIDERFESYAGITVPAKAPKADAEKIEAEQKTDYTLTPFEQSVRAAAEKEAAYDKPVLD